MQNNKKFDKVFLLNNFKIMARRCEICNKKATIIIPHKKLRGNYNPKKKKKRYPNLQWVRMEDNTRVKACTKCIKTMNKNKA